MMNLLNQLQQIEGKQAYRAYTVQHGIEMIKVLVPVVESVAFEQSFSNLQDRKKESILHLVESMGGKVKG